MADILKEGTKLEEWVVGACYNCGTISQWQRSERIYIPPDTRTTPSFHFGAHIYKCPKCTKSIYASTTVTKEEYLKPPTPAKKTWIDKLIERLFKK